MNGKISFQTFLVVCLVALTALNAIGLCFWLVDGVRAWLGLDHPLWGLIVLTATFGGAALIAASVGLLASRLFRAMQS